MGRRSHAAVLALALIVGGCGAFDSGTSWRSGNYRVGWIDQPSESVLGYEMGGGSSIRIAEPCVFAVGENQSFISFARMPASGAPLVYVLAKAKYDPSRDPGEAVEGPLSSSEFERVARSRGFPLTRELFEPARCRSGA